MEQETVTAEEFDATVEPEQKPDETNETIERVIDSPPVKSQTTDPPPTTKSQTTDPPPTTKSPGTDSSVSGAVKRRPEIKNPFGALTPITYRLVTWEKPVTSGIVLGGSLAFLIYTSQYSLLNTVCALTAAAITVNTIYVFVMENYQSVFNKGVTHPYTKQLDNPLEISRKSIDPYYDVGVDGINYIAQEGTKIVLVEDPSRSLKYAAGFLVLFFLGKWLSFVTLLSVALVFGFTLPIAYQKNKTLVDAKYEEAVKVVNSHTGQGVELAKKYCGDIFAKGKNIAASKLAKQPQGEAEKKQD